MSKKQFWSRFVLWLIFAFVVPIGIITYEYDLYKPGKEYKFTGWGLIVALIIFIGLYITLGYLCKTMKWSMTKQVLNGFRCVLLPIFFLYMTTSIIATNIDKIQIILTVCAGSEFIGIPLNPFPKWVWQRNVKDIKDAMK